MDKQKQIEEMGRMIRVALEYGDFSHLNIHDKDRFLTGRSYIATAEHLYNAGYRKIPENAVVLTDEDEIKQYKWSKMLDKMGFFKFVDNLRKETAEKFRQKMLERGHTPPILDEIYKEITEGK